MPGDDVDHNKMQNQMKAAIYEYEGQDVVPCKYCREPIYFALTQSGRSMPVTYKTGQAHWADCPGANTARKPRAKTEPEPTRAAAYRNPLTMLKAAVRIIQELGQAVKAAENSMAALARELEKTEAKK